jgi:hypothetical protein
VHKLRDIASPGTHSGLINEWKISDETAVIYCCSFTFVVPSWCVN